MIFVTVGTEKFPFDRLLKIIDEAIVRKEINECVFAQIGSSRYLPQNYPYIRMLDFNELVKYIKEARIVVCHAGEGTISLCSNSDKIPVIFPRDYHFKEHLDDHQMQYARKLKELNVLLVSYNKKDLLNAIKNYDELIKNMKLFAEAKNEAPLVKFLKMICDERINGDL